MLILGTLIVTWIARNWWKLLLLLVSIIVIHEYIVYKRHKDDGAKETGGTGEDPDAEKNAAKESGEVSDAADDGTEDPDRKA